MALNVNQICYFFGTKLTSVFVAKKRTWLVGFNILRLKVSVQFSDS